MNHLGVVIFVFFPYMVVAQTREEFQAEVINHSFKKVINYVSVQIQTCLITINQSFKFFATTLSA